MNTITKQERQSRWESSYLRRLALPTLSDRFAEEYARRKKSAPGQQDMFGGGGFEESKHPRAGKGTETGGQFTSGGDKGANTVPTKDLIPGQQDLFGGATVPQSPPAADDSPQQTQGEPPPPAQQQNLFHGIGSKDLAGQQDLFGDMDAGVAPKPNKTQAAGDLIRTAGKRLPPKAELQAILGDSVTHKETEAIFTAAGLDEITSASVVYDLAEKYPEAIPTGTIAVVARSELSKADRTGRLQQAMADVGEATTIEFTKPESDVKYFVSRATQKGAEGKWQITRIAADVPTGHQHHGSKEEAVGAAIGAFPGGGYWDEGDQNYRVNQKYSREVAQFARHYAEVCEKYRQAPESQEGGWKNVGGANMFIGEDGIIKAGCPGVKGEDVEDLDESRDEREQRQDVAESHGLTGEEVTAEQAKDLDEQPEGNVPHPGDHQTIQIQGKPLEVMQQGNMWHFRQPGTQAWVAASAALGGVIDSQIASGGREAPVRPPKPKAADIRGFRRQLRGTPTDRLESALTNASDPVKKRAIEQELDFRTAREQAEGSSINPRTQFGQAILATAWDYSIPPDALADAFSEIHKEATNQVLAHEEGTKAAREATGLNALRIRQWEDSGRDSSTWPGLDATAREMAGSYPGLGIGTGYREHEQDDTNYAAALWEVLRGGSQRLPSRTDPELLKQAAEMVDAQTGGVQPESEFSGDDLVGWETRQSPVPFSRDRKTVETYARRYLATTREKTMALAAQFADASKRLAETNDMAAKFSRATEAHENYQRTGIDTMDLLIEEVTPERAEFEPIEVNYRSAFSSVRCGVCEFRSGTSCSLVAAEVREGDVCDMFLPDKPQMLSWHVGEAPAPRREKAKYSRDAWEMVAEQQEEKPEKQFEQIDVNYGGAMGPARCSACTFGTKDDCKLVFGDFDGRQVCDMFRSKTPQMLSWRPDDTPAPRRQRAARAAKKGLRTVTAALMKTMNFD